MSSDKNNNKEATNQLNDIQAAYLSVEEKRRKEDILRTDTEKFHDFTRMLRIAFMLKNAKVTHQP